MRLCTVIHEGFLEPWVLKSLLCRDALFGVVNEDSLQEIEELSVKRSVRGDGLL